MKIAFTYNLQITNSEEEAEFDRPETVSSITEALRKLGHEVEPIDVGGPASRVVARLEALGPDLVFNTAEGSKGRFREAFYPALFDRLGLPFTGSDAYVCALTLDKQLTKMIVAMHGIPTPMWKFIDRVEQINKFNFDSMEFPMIIKPNFEGSSIGITSDSIVDNETDLRARAENLLRRFPSGILIEEFISGKDLTVPYLEKASPETHGILEPAMYEFNQNNKKYSIYEYELKSTLSDSVNVKVPADISFEQKQLVIDYSRKTIKALGIKDAARVDYRINNKGEIYFIEVNALPSLEPGASIYESAKFAGLETVDKVIGSIVQSATDRFNLNVLSYKKSIRKKQKPVVGLTYNLRRTNNSLETNGDNEAEYDSPETVQAIKQAIESYGHKVVELEATPELPAILPSSGVDVVFNIAEGMSGRARESQVPALLELLGIPYTGSDTTSLALSLDKALAKKLVNQAGINTPAFQIMSTGKEKLPKNLNFPVIVKPIAEGSSKGIISTSVLETEEELRRVVGGLADKYRQSVIVEQFLSGREFTVALLGEKRPRTLPPMEVVFTNGPQKYKTYSFESKFFNKDISFEVPAKINIKLQRELERIAKSVFTILGCRDVARVDLRLDESGNVHFIECNPLPGLTPDFSDFCVIAKSIGMDYRTLVNEILAPALRRYRENKREKFMEGRF